jgi:hypothetical protein
MHMHAIEVCMLILTDFIRCDLYLLLLLYAQTVLYYTILYCTTHRVFALPACALYNAASGHFVCALRNTFHMWSAATGTHTRRMPLLIPSHFRYTDKHSSSSNSNNTNNNSSSNKNSSSGSSGAASDVQHVTSHSVTASSSNGSGGPLGVTVDGETAMITCAAFALPHERRLVS